MMPPQEPNRRWIITALIITALCALACAPRSRRDAPPADASAAAPDPNDQALPEAGEAPPEALGAPLAARPGDVCGVSRQAWDGFTSATRDALSEVCYLQEGQCEQLRDPACVLSRAYSTQHIALLNWERDHAQATPLSRMDAYLRLFLKPTLRQHELLRRQDTGRSSYNTAPELSFTQVMAIMGDEARDPTEAYLARLREVIRQVRSDGERKVLIEAYTIVRALNSRAFEPQGFQTHSRDDIAQKLDAYEALRVRLEFPDELASPPQSGAPAPARPEVTPSAPVTNPTPDPNAPTLQM